MNTPLHVSELPRRLRVIATYGPKNDVTEELRVMANQLDLFHRELDVALKTLVDHTPSSFYTEQLEQFIRSPQ